MILDILFPKYCLGCNDFGTYLCPTCSSRLKIIESGACPYCSKINSLGKVHDSCLRPGEIDGLISSFYYNQVAKKIISKLKYRLIFDAFRAVMNLIPGKTIYNIVQLKTEEPTMMFQPVPLHIKRLRKRGFNQAETITNYIVDSVDGRKADMLDRIKSTPPLALTGSKLERARYIRRAFRLKGAVDIRGQTICLVDDVYTSGATVKEAARTLKKSGAGKVFVYTLARA